MGLSYISSADKLKQALQYWKKFTFSKNYMNLDKSIKALGTSEQDVEASQDYPGRWVVSSRSSCTSRDL